MFCSGCGNSCIPNARFCHLCGKEVPADKNEIPTTDTSSTFPCSSTGNASDTTRSSMGTCLTSSVQSFNAFCTRKAEDRSRFFKTKGTVKAKKARIEEKQPAEVRVNVGVMSMKDGRLAIRRGATLPLTVAPSIGSKELLRKALEKHSRFNQNLIDPTKTYRLLYADHEEVNTIPGSEKQFTLKQYKEEIEKPYSRISLFLWSSSDFFTSKCNGDDSSDEELQYTMYKYTTKQSPKENEEGSRFDGKVVVVDIEETCSQSGSCGPTEAAEKARSPDKFGEHASGIPLTLSSKPQHAQCPICLESYPLSQIETHADTCSMWLLEDEDFPNDCFEKPTNDISVEIPTSLDSTGAKLALKEEVFHVVETVLSDEPKRLTIRRKFMWQDFKHARETKIKPTDRVKVVFSGEPAMDDGGPRREMFSELTSFIERQFFLNGRPIKSTLALTTREFKLCGEIMGMSILQGGPAPNFMACNVVAYLTGSNLSNEDNQCQRYKKLGESLLNATNDTEVQKILSDETAIDLLEELGYTGIPQRETLESAKGIVQSLCVKDQLAECLPQLMQIKSGLAECDLITYMRQHPKIWQPVFEPGNMFDITVEDILEGSTVEFSESQLQKEPEIDTYKYFCDVLEGIGNGDIKSLHLKDFITWFTGVGQLPPLGFAKKFQITFIHGCSSGCKCRPTVSTCDFLIKIPVHINSEEVMAEMMFSAVKDSYGFGII